jgi:predicted histone-like DNA-binding protein
MSKLTLKVKKVGMKNPTSKKQGYVARVITNGTEDFGDICEMAALNTTYAPEEIVACAGLMLKAAARALKNGKIIDLGVLGRLYPSVSGKWVENADDLSISDLTPHTNYRPSQEVREAIAGATLGWASDKDKGEQEPENTDTPSDQGSDNTGGNQQGGGMLET